MDLTCLTLGNPSTGGSTASASFVAGAGAFAFAAVSLTAFKTSFASMPSFLDSLFSFLESLVTFPNNALCALVLSEGVRAIASDTCSLFIKSIYCLASCVKDDGISFFAASFAFLGCGFFLAFPLGSAGFASTGAGAGAASFAFANFLFALRISDFNPLISSL